jgi:hypothetical protein
MFKAINHMLRALNVREKSKYDNVTKFLYFNSLGIYLKKALTKIVIC